MALLTQNITPLASFATSAVPNIKQQFKEAIAQESIGNNGITHIPNSEIIKSTNENINDADEPRDVHLNFSNASLSSVVEHLAEQQNLNIISHKGLTDVKVTLNTREAFTMKRAWEILLTLVEMHGFSIVKVGNVHRVVEKKSNTNEPLPIYSSGKGIEPEDLPDSDMVIRYIYFLRNIKAETALSILNKMLDTPIQIQPDLDVCIIKEKSRSIKSAMRIIKELDQGGLRQNIKMVPILHTTPEAVARIFNDKIIGPNKKEQERVRFVTSSKKDVTYFSTNIKIIPDNERGVLILLGQEMDLEKIIDFIQNFLDVPMHDASSRIHVKEVLYHEPSKLKQLLQKIIKTPQGKQATSVKYFEDVVIAAETPGGSGRENIGGGNRLIIACNQEDWARLEPIIDNLDKPKPQVALEVMIVDVSIDMERKLAAHLRDNGLGIFGQQAAFKLANIDESDTGPTTGASIAESSIAEQLDGLTSVGETALTFGDIKDGMASTAWGLLKTLLKKDNSNIISQPFIIANNHEKCEFISTEKRRVAGELKAGYNNNEAVQTQVDIPAKTNVNITPHVNASGIVDLIIEINVADFKAVSASDPNTNTRMLSTRVSMGTGEVLVLGGLGRSSLRETRYETPGLSAIPVLGNFFKSKRKASDKKYLYAFIRPSIIKPQLEGAADDYTQFKVDYAKHQIFKTESYSKSKDPIQRFFFKPRNHSIRETVDNIKAERFSYIDNFIEKKEMPPTTEMRLDPYYRGSSHIERSKKMAKNRSVTRQAHRGLTKRNHKQV